MMAGLVHHLGPGFLPIMCSYMVVRPHTPNVEFPNGSASRTIAFLIPRSPRLYLNIRLQVFWSYAEIFERSKFDMQDRSGARLFERRHLLQSATTVTVILGDRCLESALRWLVWCAGSGDEQSVGAFHVLVFQCATKHRQIRDIFNLPKWIISSMSFGGRWKLFQQQAESQQPTFDWYTYIQMSIIRPHVSRPILALAN